MRNQIISVNGRALVTTMQRVCTVVASATLSAMLVLGAASSATASVPLTSRLIPGAVINKDFSHFLNDPTDMFVTSDYQLGCDGQSALFGGANAAVSVCDGTISEDLNSWPTAAGAQQFWQLKSETDISENDQIIWGCAPHGVTNVITCTNLPNAFAKAVHIVATGDGESSEEGYLETVECVFQKGPIEGAINLSSTDNGRLPSVVGPLARLCALALGRLPA